MVDGRMRKYFEEVCLLEQTFVIDGETKVSRRSRRPAAMTGVSRSRSSSFSNWRGRKEEADFAAEVAATAGG